MYLLLYSTCSSHWLSCLSFSYGFVGILYVLWLKSFVRYMCCEYFPSRYLSIHFPTGIFWGAEMFNFNDVQFINLFTLWLVLFVWHPKSLCLLWGHKDTLLCFFRRLTILIYISVYNPGQINFFSMEKGVKVHLFSRDCFLILQV